MAITVKIKQTQKQEISFPCLMAWAGGGANVVVLFTSETCGTILANPANDQGVGAYDNDWLSVYSPNWKPSPPVTLSNS